MFRGNFSTRFARSKNINSDCIRGDDFETNQREDVTTKAAKKPIDAVIAFFAES